MELLSLAPSPSASRLLAELTCGRVPGAAGPSSPSPRCPARRPASRARTPSPGRALGRILLTSLHIGRKPDRTLARAIIDFAAQFLTADHEDVPDLLRHL